MIQMPHKFGTINIFEYLNNCQPDKSILYVNHDFVDVELILGQFGNYLEENWDNLSLFSIEMGSFTGTKQRKRKEMLLEDQYHRLN